MSTEQQINKEHKARWAAAAAEYGGIHNVPSEVSESLGEQLRQAWVNFYAILSGSTPDGSEKPRRDKTKKMAQFCAENIGKRITALELAAAVESSNGTAYQFISDHRSLFRGLGHGAYEILDPNAERAAAKGSGSKPDAATVASIDIANAAIGQMAGERPQAVGKP